MFAPFGCVPPPNPHALTSFGRPTLPNLSAGFRNFTYYYHHRKRKFRFGVLIRYCMGQKMPQAVALLKCDVHNVGAMPVLHGKTTYRETCAYLAPDLRSKQTKPCKKKQSAKTNISLYVSYTILLPNLAHICSNRSLIPRRKPAPKRSLSILMGITFSIWVW